ncbi:hypothetical protein M1203_35555 [Streptomyces sp. 35G-GA-8]|nr:hypothetical protein [Streptomyces sp. 35G-GA-8]MCL7382116.1 hypothetical protein [Streptomyces sp. 35G-GA-8]
MIDWSGPPTPLDNGWSLDLCATADEGRVLEVDRHEVFCERESNWNGQVGIEIVSRGGIFSELEAEAADDIQELIRMGSVVVAGPRRSN